MNHYTNDLNLDNRTFHPFDTEEGGALETSGDMQTEISVDFENDAAMGGLFRQVKGKAEIVWPATEHAFVLHGQVTIHYHRENEKKTYNPGEGWLINKGERVTWTVTSDTFVKSFFLLLNE